jgi:BCD family chlorophyll transporter-like MFS transporter
MGAQGTGFGWLGIVRLGLVQTALGAIVVMTTSTLNRVIVVEIALPALLPGVLVAIHYFVQLSRPRFGYGSDNGHRRTPWIIGGIATLGLGGVLASIATALMATSPLAGSMLAVVAFLIIGAGVGASGTCLLVLLAACVPQKRRAAAASITWIMMIAGFAITAGIVGSVLDPFSFSRLIMISTCVAVIALVVTIAALWNLEHKAGVDSVPTAAATEPGADKPSFRDALGDVLGEAHTRRFAAFVFLSMLAYSAQDLVLEPFAGAVFGLTPGESTRLGGTQHAGVLIGMLLVAVLGSRFTGARDAVLRACMVTGCVGSAVLLLLLAASGYAGGSWPLAANVFALGIANGAFAVAAIGAMMGLVSEGHRNRDGVRMGVWGAAQAVAFGLGGIVGTLAVDVVRIATGSAVHAYGLVFVAQALLFAAAVMLAVQVARNGALKTTAAALEARARS